MKKTQFIELLKTIKGTMISYAAIAVFVMLGVAIFVGIESGGDSMQINAEQAAEAGRLHDLEIFFPYGMEEDDLKTLSLVDGVDEIEGSRCSYEFIQYQDSSYYAIVHQLSDTVDISEGVKGILPQKDGEIAVDELWAKDEGIELGDELVLTTNYDTTRRTLKGLMDYDGDLDAMKDLREDETPASPLKSTRYKVTAFVTSPMYLYFTIGASPENGIAINTNLYVSADAWAEDTNSGYIDMRIRSDALREYSIFDEEYESKLNELKKRLKPVVNKITKQRLDQLHTHSDLLLSQVKDQLSDAEKKLSDAEQELKDGRQKLEDGKQEFEKGKKELEDGKTTLKNGKNELESNEKLVLDGKAQIKEYEILLSQNEELLKTAEEKLNRIETAVNDLTTIGDEIGSICDKATEMATVEGATISQISEYLQSQNLKGYADRLNDDIAVLEETYEENNEELDAEFPGLKADIEQAQNIIQKLQNTEGMTISDVLPLLLEWQNYRDKISQYKATAYEYLDEKKAELKTQKELLSDAKKQLADKKVELSDAELKIKNGWDEYYSGLNKLEEGQKELKKAQADLLQGEADLAQGTSDYIEGKEQLDREKANYEELKDALENLEDYSASYLASYNNGSLLAYKTGSICGKNIRNVLALLFILVGVLVCYSAVSRLVNDQIISIGTKKALGLHQKEITKSFVFYSLSAALIGCILGSGLSWVLAKIVLSAMMKPTFPIESHVYLSYTTIFALWAIELVLIGTTAYLTCRRILKQRAVELLAGPKPPHGKRRFYENWSIWEKIPLLTKTIINNCMNDKRRVRGTLIGICGCASLIIMALTILYNVMNGYTIQTEDYYHFDTIVYFDNTIENAQENLQNKLDESGYKNMLSSATLVSAETGDKDALGIQVYSPQDMEQFKEFSTMQPYTKSKQTPYEGIWMCSSYMNAYGGKAQQTVKVLDMSGDEYNITVDGFYTNYSTTGEMVMTPECYEEVFGTAWKANCFLVDADQDLKQLSNTLNDIDGYLYTYDLISYIKLSYDMFQKLAFAIVGAALVLSVIMNFLVVMNLLSMFVSEKKRELIILRINGYTTKDAKRYIYSDTILLTGLSLAVALVVGTIAGNACIRSMESSILMFAKGFSITACAIGVAATIILVIIASHIALRKLEGLKLTDINK